MSPKFLINWCARRDCSRLRRSSSAALRTAAALRGSVQPGADAGLSNSACCLPGVRIAADKLFCPAGISQTKNMMVRPERFELPASWFVARFFKVTKIFARQALTANELCY